MLQDPLTIRTSVATVPKQRLDDALPASAPRIALVEDPDEKPSDVELRVIKFPKRPEADVIIGFINRQDLFDDNVRTQIIEDLSDPFAHGLPPYIRKFQSADIDLYDGILCNLDGPQRKIAKSVVESNLLGEGERCFVRQALRALLLSRAEQPARENRPLVELWIKKSSVFKAEDLDCLFRLAEAQGGHTITPRLKAARAGLISGPEIDIYSMVGISPASEAYVRACLEGNSARRGAERQTHFIHTPGGVADRIFSGNVALQAELFGRRALEVKSGSEPLQFIDVIRHALARIGVRSPHIDVQSTAVRARETIGGVRLHEEPSEPRWVVQFSGF